MNTDRLAILLQWKRLRIQWSPVISAPLQLRQGFSTDSAPATPMLAAALAGQRLPFTSILMSVAAQIGTPSGLAMGPARRSV
jgi:hypothetical protein